MVEKYILVKNVYSNKIHKKQTVNLINASATLATPTKTSYYKFMKNIFTYDYKYHYYEEEIYSMGRYFEGFNLRQLNRLMFTYNQIALSYQSYMQLMDNKTRANQPISKLEESSLVIYKSLYSKVKEIVAFMNKFPETSKNGDKLYSRTFGDAYLKHMHDRCWVQDDEYLRNQKWVRYTTEQGKKWQYGPTEQYYPEDKIHIAGINNFNVLVSFGHWIEYFKIGCFENEFITKELNEFDLDIFNKFYKEALKLRTNLIKLNYLRKR